MRFLPPWNGGDLARLGMGYSLIQRETKFQKLYKQQGREEASSWGSCSFGQRAEAKTKRSNIDVG
jgi:hypothetical protein